jgi:GNAT superfamily N-acetyltransferase
MIRRLLSADLADALMLTQAENWSHRLEDWQFHHQLGRGWAACDDQGALAGTAIWWAYGERFGTIGLVVVDRRQQGRGIGRRLMETIIEDAGSRTLHLIATRAGLKLYRQCGFEEIGTIEQRQGVPVSHTEVAPPAGTSLRPVTSDDTTVLSDLDTNALGAPRDHVIRAVLAAGTGVLATQGGQPTGFALMRAAGRGLVIGPVVAPGQALAIALISFLLRRNEGFARVDLPGDAHDVAQWLDDIGLVCVDQVTTMERGEPPSPRGPARTFGLVSQALS